MACNNWRRIINPPSGPVDTSTTPAVGYNYNQMADGLNNSNLDSISYPNMARIEIRIMTRSRARNPSPASASPGTTATVTTAALHLP